MMSIFSSGDFRFFWPENIINFVQIPSSWDSILNTGVGINTLGSLWINSYLNFTAIFSRFGLSWDWIGFLFFVLPAILLSFFSAYFLFSNIFSDKKIYGFLSGFIYLGNTYFLMIFAGGQSGVALSYSIVPFVVLCFIRSLKSLNLMNSIIFGLVLSLQVLLDLRIAYITLGIIFLLWIFYFSMINIINLKVFLSRSLLFNFIIPLLIVILIHSYWILPIIIFHQNPLKEFGINFSNIEIVKFFSFANLENSISLLHPNFPENIFGKIYFMRAEFMLIPILAFSSLLFVKLKPKVNVFDENRIILFFAIIGLISIFLSKGANDPFGGIYIWMINNIPGFIMFRDPTKFYIFIVLSYSVLIPYSIFNISLFLKSRIKFSKSTIRSIFFISPFLYLIFLIWPLFLRSFSVNHMLRPIPNDYVLLKDFLVSQPDFSRTLWIPQWQRFGYFSNTHPAIGREELFKGNTEKQLTELGKLNSEKKLRHLGVRYVIVPFDSEGEIFLNDRKYDDEKYRKTIKSLKRFTWLTEVQKFGKIIVFEVKKPKDHFWCDCDAQIEYKFINPSKYEVLIRNAKKGDILVFSEGFDSGWEAEGPGFEIESMKFESRLNSFVLSKDGDYELRIFYKPQKWVNYGLVISVVTFILLITFCISNLAKKAKK